MKIRKPLTSLALLASITFAGCAANLELPRDNSKADEQAPTKYVGLWTGLDDNQSSCEVEVLAYEENVDAKIPGADEELASRELSKLRRSMRLKVSLQADPETVFAAISKFDEQSTAYAQGELRASNAVDELLTENLIVTLDAATETLSAVSYSLDAATACRELRRVDSIDPSKEVDPPSPDFVPHPRGSARR